MDLINFSIFNWVINMVRLAPTPLVDSLLKEDGDYILQENGDRILL